MNEYWSYKSSLIPGFVFEPFLEAITDYCQNGVSKKRRSCVFNIRGSFSGYNELPSYDWENSPLLLREILAWVQDYTSEHYDYVLIHIYPTGEASIGWHM